MQHSIANSNAAESCIGVRSAAFSCRSHKVRCLHLTVNSQWKLLIFTPKRSFGWKSNNAPQRSCGALVWNPQRSCGFHTLLHLRTSSWDAACGPGLRSWSTLNWSSPYGLDQYALQALRPEVQKEKKYAPQPSVVVLLTASQALRPDLQYTPQALRPEVYAFQDLRPEMQ